MKIRPYQQGDEKEILELDARELPSIWNRRTLANWHWKFTSTNPAGHSLIWVAEHNDHLIAHFAAVPYKLKVLDQVVTASHTIGALVDKKYQNRGLLKFVGEKLMEEQAKHNIPFTWGFPNRLAHKFENIVLNYRDLLIFDEWKLSKANLKTSPVNDSFLPITVFDQEYDRLWESCSVQYPIAVKRDHIYLNWRYLSRPDWKYFPFALYQDNQLKGYIVLKLYQEDTTLRGHIVDIFAHRDDEETLHELIRGGLNVLQGHHVDEVTIWFWGNSLVEKLFTENGFERMTIDRPLILRLNKEHPYQDKVIDKSLWYFTMGDSTEII